MMEGPQKVEIGNLQEGVQQFLCFRVVVGVALPHERFPEDVEHKPVENTLRIKIGKEVCSRTNGGERDLEVKYEFLSRFVASF